MAKRLDGKPPAPPTKFSQALADEICERMALGETYHKICEDAHMPETVSLWRWRQKHPEFGSAFARAQVDQVQTWADQIVTLIDEAEPGYNVTVPLDSPDVERIEANGNVTFRFRKHQVAHAVEMVNVRKWLMAKIIPHLYGDRQQVDVRHSYADKDDDELLHELRSATEAAGLTPRALADLLAAGGAAQ